MSTVDVVVVAYNSSDTLRACVEPLTGVPSVNVIVVDNASPDDSLPVVADLPIDAVRAERNGGFSFGCNLGARRGSGDYVLFLNPDAVLHPDDLQVLVQALDASPDVAVAGPRILDGDGSLLFTRRRFPGLRSTLAQALFLHRLLPGATWADEMIRSRESYEGSGEADWLSGACLLTRRSALQAIGGFDEGFFLYCEDTDLCRRLRDEGWRVRYEPGATARHQEGSSAPRSDLLAIHAASRARYARVHRPRALAELEVAAVGLSALTHAVVSAPRRRSTARGHLASLRALAS